MSFSFRFSLTTFVSGSVHAGMYRGALGILDGYGMRGYILDLASKGYDVKVVGHSLGAGEIEHGVVY